MIKCVTAIWDAKAGCYCTDRVHTLNDALAIREFMAAFARPESQWAMTPEDFTLMKLGTWDNVTGKSDDLAAAEPLMSGREAVAQLQERDNALSNPMTNGDLRMLANLAEDVKPGVENK